LPFGIFSEGGSQPRAGARIGGFVLDLKALAEDEQVKQQMRSFKTLEGVLGQTSLNAFAELGRSVHRAVRGDLQRILSQTTDVPAILRDNEELRRKALIAVDKVKMHLPMRTETIPTSMPATTTPIKSAFCSEGPTMRCSPTTLICLLATTAAPPASWYRAPLSVGLAARSCQTQRRASGSQRRGLAADWTLS